MVDHECPKDVVSCQTGLFLTSLRQTSSFAVHTLKRQMSSLGDTARAVRQSKTGFSFGFYGNHCKTGVRLQMYTKKKKKKVGGISEEYLRE